MRKEFEPETDGAAPQHTSVLSALSCALKNGSND